MFPPCERAPVGYLEALGNGAHPAHMLLSQITQDFQK